MKEKSNAEKLRDIIGPGGVHHVTAGPNWNNLSEEEKAGVILNSLEEVLSGNATEAELD